MSFPYKLCYDYLTICNIIMGTCQAVGLFCLIWPAVIEYERNGEKLSTRSGWLVTLVWVGLKNCGSPCADAHLSKLHPPQNNVLFWGWLAPSVRSSFSLFGLFPMGLLTRDVI
jgi:hypothetical protein